MPLIFLASQHGFSMHCSKQFVLLLGVLCGGCSMHPLPEDVTPLNTYQIVQKIRCEVRDSLRLFVIGALKKSDPIIAADLKSGKRTFASVTSKQLSPDGNASLQRYDKSALAYEFVFDMAENNTAGGNIGVASILSRGPLTFTLLPVRPKPGATSAISGSSTHSAGSCAPSRIASASRSRRARMPPIPSPAPLACQKSSRRSST